MKIPINKVKPNPFQERKTIDGLGKFRESMEKYGFWGSVIGRKVGDTYQIAFGERRLRAAKLAGIKEIDIEVRELNDREMKKLTTVENTMRDEVYPEERAEHIARLQKDYDLTTRDLAEELFIPETTIREYLEYARARVDTKKLVSSGKIGWTKAIAAEKVGGIELVKTVIAEKLTDTDIADIKKAIDVAPERKKELITRQMHPIELETERIKKSKDSPDEKAEEIIRAIDMCCSKVRYLQTIFHRLSSINQERALLSLKIHNKVFAELHKKGEMLKVTNK